jgi:hypothetical protein
VFIWAHRPSLADAAQVEAIPAMRPPVTVVLGGPGWEGEVPERGRWVGSLSEAVTVLQRAAGG